MTDQSIFSCTKCRGLRGYQERLIPVRAFGNPNAPVTMLSLNPSYREYKSRGARKSPLYSPLDDHDNITRDTLTQEMIDAIEARQRDYFRTGEHLNWFDPAERFLNLIHTNTWGVLSFGIHHAENTSNIDIVKCPTDPVWSRLREDRLRV